LLTIKGIKIAYPSNAADMKGLMKAAYYDPNPGSDAGAQRFVLEQSAGNRRSKNN
jgi:pyruvate/2-oxoglutarate/acetoin dehydrogenase E1 component